MNRTVVIILILVSLIGFVDASFLATQHYQGDDVVCEIGGHELGNCNSVLTSEYATILGVPNSLIGVVYYFMAFVLSALMLSYKDKRLLQLLVLLTAGGLLASAWFVYLMLFVLNAICVYCLVSAGVTAILFAVSVLALLHTRKEKAGSA